MDRVHARLCIPYYRLALICRLDFQPCPIGELKPENVKQYYVWVSRLHFSSNWVMQSVRPVAYIPCARLLYPPLLRRFYPMARLLVAEEWPQAHQIPVYPHLHGLSKPGFCTEVGHHVPLVNDHASFARGQGLRPTG